jgi:hypothetical protein
MPDLIRHPEHTEKWENSTFYEIVNFQFQLIRVRAHYKKNSRLGEPLVHPSSAGFKSTHSGSGKIRPER